MWRASLRLGAWVGLAAFAAVAVSGDTQGKLMFQQQPMKMASAEALWNTEKPASFSLFAIGDLRKHKNTFNIAVPHLLSILATNDNWRSASNASEIQATLPPPDDRESAILISLGPGNYTTIVRGAGGTTGIALNEIYRLDN